MNYKKAEKIEKAEYKLILQAIGALSNLFSDSEKVYLNYRVHENCYCYAFGAENLSRSDIAIDAKKNNVGIGLKTFLRQNDNSLQKIAEFNALANKLKNKTTDESVALISMWRNQRLQTSKNLYGIDTLIYHCVIRDHVGFHVFEEEMKFIGITSNHFEDEKKILFQSNGEEYSFNKSKSTLYKRFNTNKILDTFQVSAIDRPFDFLKGINLEDISNTHEECEFAILPLYSERSGKVEERSGLNQWNAAPRKPGTLRHPDEVYIPISTRFNEENKGFFPPRDTSFNMILPSGKIILMKVCQSGDKALMSNPNKDLGNWLLRDILNLNERELLTQEILKMKGFDSIIVYKNNDKEYRLDVYTEKSRKKGSNESS